MFDTKMALSCYLSVFSRIPFSSPRNVAPQQKTEEGVWREWLLWLKIRSGTFDVPVRGLFPEISWSPGQILVGANPALQHNMKLVTGGTYILLHRNSPRPTGIFKTQNGCRYTHLKLQLQLPWTGPPIPHLILVDYTLAVDCPPQSKPIAVIG